MKIATIIGIAAVGGFFYAHRQRGGELTLESMKATAKSLLGAVQQKARSSYQPGTNSQRAYDGDDADLRH